MHSKGKETRLWGKQKEITIKKSCLTNIELLILAYHLYVGVGVYSIVKSTLLAVFVFHEMKCGTIHLNGFGNRRHHLGILSILPALHDRFSHTTGSQTSSELYLPLHCCLVFISLKIIHFPTVSLVSFLCLHVKRYLLMVASVCLSVCLCRHIVVN